MKSYRFTYPDFEKKGIEGANWLRERELTLVGHTVVGVGYALMWAEAFREYVVFYKDDTDPATLPDGFVPYSDTELRELFGDDKPDLSLKALRLIHSAKKVGANVGHNTPAEEVRDLAQGELRI